MSLSIVHTRAALGVNAPPITVEVHISKGLPGLTMVGLPETTVKEARDRVRSAIINSGYEYPAKKITINLAPADLPKEGGRYDLPIAIALLAASEQLTANKLDEYELDGELALTGALRGVPGAISSATEAIKSGRKIIVAKDNEDEVGLINGEGCLIADICKLSVRFWKVSTLSNARNQLMQYPGRYNMISVMLSVRNKESEDWKLPLLAGTTFY